MIIYKNYILVGIFISFYWQRKYIVLIGISNYEKKHGIALFGLLVMVLVGITVSWAATGMATATTTDDEEWLENETDSFIIEYKSGYEDDATHIGDVADNAYPELQETFPGHVSDLSFEEPVHIRVYPGDEWDRSDYVLFWRDTTPVRIHVQAPSDSEVDDDWYEHGIAHELGNMFLWDEAGQYDNYAFYTRNPSWFHQGLTEYYVYQTPTVEDQFPPWAIEQDLNETIAAGDGDFQLISDNMYHGGHLLSMYLVDEYGEDAVWDLLRNDASSWNDAVETELGVAQPQLEENWYRWAEENIGGDYSDRYDSTADDTENGDDATDSEDTSDEFETEINDLVERIEYLETQITELEEDTGDLEDLETQISALEEDAEDIADLETRVTELETAIENLEADNNNVESGFSVDDDGAGFGIGVALASIFLSLYFLKYRTPSNETKR